MTLKDIGYRRFSAYLIAAIRYDLRLLGPHKYYNGDDWGDARMAKFDAKTAKAFHQNLPRTISLDHLLDAAAGRELTPAELPYQPAHSTLLR